MLRLTYLHTSPIPFLMALVFAAGACDNTGDPVHHGPRVFRSLASNGYGTCLLDNAGSATCWGYDAGGLYIPANSPKFVQLSMNDYVTCGLRTNGMLRCWTRMGSRALEPPTGTFTALDLGKDHGCALDAQGKITCWGDLSGGGPPAGKGYRSLSCGTELSCAVNADNRLECWGWGAAGYHLAEKIQKVAVHSHVCVILEDEKLRCLANTPNDATGVTTPPAGRYREVDVAREYACAINHEGQIACWGQDAAGRLNPPSGGGYQALALGNKHGCALHESGILKCWGLYRFPYQERFSKVASAYGVVCAIGQVGNLACLATGDPSYDRNLTPPPGTGFEHLAMGSAHACALDAVGAITCFGNDSHGQTQAPAGTGWSAIEAGGVTSCARRGSTDWTCWGDTSLIPDDTTALQAISLGGSVVCWVRVDGSADCAGDFVDNDEMGQMTAVAPSGGGFVSIKASSWNACALNDDGGVACVGFGFIDGTNSSPPQRRYTALAVSGEDSWSYALRDDGVVELIGSWEPWLPGRFISITATAGQLCGVDDDGFLVCTHPWVFDPR